jgi:hypothetical protein
METEASLDETGSVVLDASGNGTVVLRPSNAHERWVITTTVVRVNSGTNIPSCVTYAGSSGVTGGTPVDTTVTGNGDSSDTRVEINPGSFFTVVWTGGDVGATASVTVTGKRIQRR